MTQTRLKPAAPEKIRVLDPVWDRLRGEAEAVMLRRTGFVRACV